MSTLIFPFRGSGVFMKSLQIPADFLSTWMPVFTDASGLDFRQGTVSSFQAGANARRNSRQLLCSESHTVEWSMVGRKSRFAVSAAMVMCPAPHTREHKTPVRDLEKSGSHLAGRPKNSQ